MIKSFTILFALALLAIAGYGVNKTMSNDAGLSDLALANVEALADGENGNDDKTCYNTITTKAGNKILYCGSCTWENGTNTVFSGTGICP